MRLTSLRFVSHIVTPNQYSKENATHYIINTRAVNDFVNMYPALGKQDRLLDFGCGTGETTVATSKGVLGKLGQPGEVMGVDISEDMINHCQAHHRFPNTNFQQLDVTQAKSFISSNLSSFSTLTSFSCLHWVPDQPAAIRTFNKILKTGGKFLFLINGNQVEWAPRKVFEEMKSEEKWKDFLKNSSWVHYNTVHVNNSWMSTMDQHCFGSIIQEDYVRLMEANGFRVDQARTDVVQYTGMSKDIVDKIFHYITQFPELEGGKRREFFCEYLARVRELTDIDSDSYYPLKQTVIMVLGEKVKDI